MAINPSTKYPGRTTPPDGNYPFGGGQNETVDGADDGTPLEIATLNDFWGFFQKLLQTAGLTADGNPDTAAASQYFEALLESGIITDDAIAGLSISKLTEGSVTLTQGNYQLFIDPTQVEAKDNTDGTLVRLRAIGGTSGGLSMEMYHGSSERFSAWSISGHEVFERPGTTYSLKVVNTGSGLTYPLGPGDTAVESVRKSLFTLPSATWGGSSGDYFNTSPINKTLTGIPSTARIYGCKVIAYDYGLAQQFSIPCYVSFVASGGFHQVGNMRLHSSADPSTYDLMELVVDYDATAVD